MATAITAAATPAQVARVVLPAALEVGPATAGVLVALEASGGGVWLVGASGDLPPSLVAWARLSGEAAGAGSPPTGEGDPLALTLRTGRPAGPFGPSDPSDPSGETGTAGAWPLLLNGRPVGAMGLAGVAPAPAGDGQAVLPLLAQLSVLALERVRLEERLRHAARAQDAFLDRVAHDLRTPLTSLRGFTQLLLRQLRRTGSVEPQRLTPALLRIEEQTNILNLLVSRLLDLGRLDASGEAGRRGPSSPGLSARPLRQPGRDHEPERARTLEGEQLRP
ncbi:MAG TPA: histidine kinase dimerization/phospho-acceptor domain-containing protein [Chloroflexota bacterium]|nr:histidine kinase dimerization/phospho-acceptor domain-containing protein [Chloroflexota bacterium]